MRTKTVSYQNAYRRSVDLHIIHCQFLAREKTLMVLFESAKCDEFDILVIFNPMRTAFTPESGLLIW
jgi:hypothetical protein